MSLDYYLKLKNKYNLLIFSLNDIVDNYNEVIDFSYEEQLDSQNKNELKEDIIHFIEIKNMYKKQKETLQMIQRETDKIITNMCIHEYTQDTIDIDPDRCKVIHYCKICGFTKKN